MKVEETVYFQCPLEVLFDYLEQPEKQKLWMAGLLSNESTSGSRKGVGSMFRMVIKEGRTEANYDGEVTAYDPPHRLEVVFWGGCLPKGARMRADYRLREEGGQTRLDYVATSEGMKVGLFMRLMMPLILVFARRQVRGFFRTLRTLVERSAAAA